LHITNNINLILDQAKSRQKRGWLGQVLTAVDDLDEAQESINEKTTKQSNLMLSTIQNINSNTQTQISALSNKINQGIELINSLQQQTILWNAILDRQKVN
jgi:hypothetical protein